MSRKRLQEGSYRVNVCFSLDEDLDKKMDRVCDLLGVKRSLFARACLRFVVDNLFERMSDLDMQEIEMKRVLGLGVNE